MKILMCGPIAASGGVSTHTKNIINQLLNLGVEVHFYNQWDSNRNFFYSSFKKLYLRSFGLFIESFRRRMDYDIIHIQASGGLASFVSAISGAIASIVLRKKLVVTFHHSKSAEFVSKYKSFVGFVVSHASKFILVSSKQKNIFTTNYGNFAEKFEIIFNGYDSDLYIKREMFDCRKILKIPEDKKIIFNISNLIDTKGHKYLILALEKVLTTRKDIICYIAGRGYLKEELESLITDLSLQNHIHLIGWISDEDVPLWMSASDIFVMPSLAEGNPTVMFEALGSGLPFIGTNVGGIPEIINTPDYGIICEPANPEDLAEKIKWALEKNWDRKLISNYSKNFTWRKIALDNLNIYKEIIKG